ncbi:MAG: hypothetical protein SFU56_07605 [Capsulimonadales bacterium]|nr:hypothetical protein [Capsulimonadales bacterium]
MIEAPFHKPGTIRIWFDEAKPYDFAPGRVVKFEIATQPSAIRRERRVTVELVLRRAGLFPYGLLGAAFIPNVSNVLQIEVNCDSQTDVMVLNSLALQPDTVLIGLPYEYAQAVLNSVAHSDISEQLGSGLIRFDCAAHGEVGSSSSAFVRLSLIVTQLLTLDVTERSYNDIASILTQIE